MVKSVEMECFLDQVSLHTMGAAEGMLVMKDNSIAELLGMQMGDFSVSC